MHQMNVRVRMQAIVERQARLASQPSRRQTVYRLRATVAETNGASAFRPALGVALEWLRQQWQRPLPGGGLVSATDRTPAGAALELAAVPDAESWAAELNEPDRGTAYQAAVPGRLWRTELSLHREEHGPLWFAIRVSFTNTGREAPIRVIFPSVVRELIERPGLGDVVALAPTPGECRDDAAVERLFDLVSAPRRTLPVLAISQPDRNAWEGPGEAPPWLLDPGDLARQFQGLAHVVWLSFKQAFSWTRLVGKEWSVFGGAVRLYLPGLDFDRDNYLNHKLWLPRSILHASLGEKTGAAAFVEDLRRQLWLQRAGGDAGPGPWLADVRLRAAEVQAQRAPADSAAAWHAENAALRDKLAHAEAEARQWSDALQEERQQREDAEGELLRLRARLDRVESLCRRHGVLLDDPIANLPATYEDLAPWAETHFAGRLVLHPRARRALKDARYHDLAVVCQALRLLAVEWRDSKLGIDGAKDRFDNGLRAWTMTMGKSSSRAGEEGEAYYVRYPPAGGQRRFLEWHLRKGSDHDEQHCLRIYFFWCDTDHQVVVGWLPGHLPNRQT